jgi:hypothetical protein
MMEHQSSANQIDGSPEASSGEAQGPNEVHFEQQERAERADVVNNSNLMRRSVTGSAQAGLNTPLLRREESSA